MFKRANKITALLVAAASVMSVVPAMATDYKKVDSLDGTVYNAVAYKDGIVYVDGEVNDLDEANYYVDADGKYNELSDLDNDADFVLFGDKYLNVEDGDNFVNMETGEVTDDSIAEDEADDAASALRKEIKDDNDGRYLEAEQDDMKTLALIPGAKFGENWYSTTYTKAVGSTALNVYTDTKGAYIDADYNLGKIKVTTTAGSVNVENTKDLVDFGVDITDSTKTAKKSLTTTVSAVTVIGQDADYIYREATITLNVNATLTNSKISHVYGKEVAACTGFVVGTSSGNQTVAFNVIQKISKAQDSDDDVDGAKFANSVTNYLISDDGAKAKTLLANGSDTANGYSVTKDGKIISYRYDGKNVKAQAITLKTKASLPYTDISDGSDTDVESATAYGFDVDGNLWALDGGYIKQFDNDEDFNKEYKVDGSFDELSVYDKDNIVAWCEDDEVYSLIGGTSTSDDDTTDVAPVETAAGWVQAANGTWSYVNADGTKATGWKLDGAWYYLKADGVMATGWVLDGATWYYTNASGAMQTGWLNDNGTWYYLNANGSMAANTTVGGYVLGASGAWVK